MGPHWPPSRVGRAAAAARPGSASVSLLARARQVATDMPAGIGCGRTFLGTFRFSGPAVPTHRAKVSGRDMARGVLVLLSPRGPMRGLPHLRASLSWRQGRHWLRFGVGRRAPGAHPGLLPIRCPSRDDRPSSSMSPTRSNAAARQGLHLGAAGPADLAQSPSSAQGPTGHLSSSHPLSQAAPLSCREGRPETTVGARGGTDLGGCAVLTGLPDSQDRQLQALLSLC